MPSRYALVELVNLHDESLEFEPIHRVCFGVDAPKLLKDLAAAIAEVSGTKVVFELPDDVEKAGYSTATKARLDGSKLKQLGWTMEYDVKSGIGRTIEILKG